MNDIVELVYDGELESKNLHALLEEHGVKDIRTLKNELMDVLIQYIRWCLKDHIITQNEKANLEFLKRYFKIEEGDFYKHRYHDLADILGQQFHRLYFDNKIDDEESLYNVDLQELFDLSYDQFDEFKTEEVKKAIENGADISDLDTANFPKQE